MLWHRRLFCVLEADARAARVSPDRRRRAQCIVYVAQSTARSNRTAATSLVVQTVDAAPTIQKRRLSSQLDRRASTFESETAALHSAPHKRYRPHKELPLTIDEPKYLL